MTMRLALILAATALTPAGLAAQDKPAAPKAAAPASPPPQLQALAQSCAARKFETTVELTANGKKGSRKLTLCGKEGQTDAQWAATLKDGAAKIAASKMAQPGKGQAIAALNAEIARIEAASAAVTMPPLAIAPPAERPPEYSALPAIPPAPKAAARTALATPALAPVLARPRLTIKCAERGDRGDGETCAFLEKDTVLTIRADDDLPGGATLRFLRKGDVRGEVTVAQMRKGQVVRAKLPSPLCAGVATSKAEIQILSRGAGASSQVADKLGPYGLRC